MPASGSKVLITLFILLFGGGVTILKAQDMETVDIKKPIKLSGNINLQLERYAAKGIDPRKKDFSWLLNGNPRLELLGVHIPFSFLFSNFENRFYQPFNQFGVSPYYKWAKLHLGYRNINYNPYTLAGHRILGAGAELTPGKLRLGFMYGQLRRSTAIDSAMHANPFAVRPMPVYKRMGLSAKIGVGNHKSYFDIIYFKGWDDENSLQGTLLDSAQAAENTAIGISTQLTVLKKFTFRSDIGLSAYTNNLADSSYNESGNDGFKESVLSPFIKRRPFTRYYMAGDMRFGYKHANWGTELIYKRIDPNYTSMGAYFFQSDIREVTVANYIRLDSGRLNINASIGFQKDNLENQKTSESKRFIGSVNISYVPQPAWGLNLNYSNFGITNNPLILSPGAELFKQVNNSIMLLSFFNWMNSVSVRNLNLVASYQVLNSPQNSIGATADLNTFLATATYSHTLIQNGINFNGSANYISSYTALGEIISMGGSVGCMVKLPGGKTSLTAQLNHLINSLADQENGYTTRANVGLGYQPGQKHNVQLLFHYLKNQSLDTEIIANYNEKSIQLIYGIIF